MSRILITGGAGFIGSAVCRHLADAGADVLNVDKLTYAGNLASLKQVETAPNYRFAKVDICDRAAVAEAFAAFRPDRVIHLAAESHVDRSISGAADFIDTNIVGTFVMLEAARAYWSGLPAESRDTFRFLHVSTDEVYGSLGPDGLFSEDDGLRPVVSLFVVQGGFRPSRLGLGRGPTALPASSRTARTITARSISPKSSSRWSSSTPWRASRCRSMASGENIRDWLYVDDHARALDLIATRGRIGEKYNVGGRNERRNIDVVRTICAILDRLDFARGTTPHESLITYRHRPSGPRRSATRSTRPSSKPSSAGAPRRPSRPASRRRCAGISTMSGGGGPCATRSMPASGWAFPWRR
jgi:dTDP-glucose 4,6-dehydratase